MNILLEGIIRLEPADTELQSSRSGLRIAWITWSLLGEGGGGGSLILEPLDHLIHSLVQRIQNYSPVDCRLRIAGETWSLLGEGGGWGSFILKLLDHLIP